jgi:poly(hydroxyalkanoate) granule-associated protein
MAKAKTPNKTIETTDTDIARKIWLAGVGAYGRMFTETQGAVEKLATGANEAFDQLVAKGEQVEDKVRETIAKSPQGGRVVSLVETATNQMQSFGAGQRAALEARIGKVRKSVSETLAPLNVSALGHAVEKLSVQVESLTREVAALKAAKTAAARPQKAGPTSAAKAPTVAKTAKPKAKKAV